MERTTLLLNQSPPPILSPPPKSNPNFFFLKSRPRPGFKLSSSGAANGPGESSSVTKPAVPPSRPFPGAGEVVSVGDDGVPLEGVIQFDKPSPSSRIENWGRVALLAGGDVLFLLVFSAIGRFSHGLPVFDSETFRTADPFVAGWFLGAYFLGGFGDDGKGVNGRDKAVVAAAKSWAVGIPTGILIRSISLGHPPPIAFGLVTMGTTGVLLIGWRALLYTLFPNGKSNKSDVYKRGSPFELFELLMSLVRRW